MTSPADLKVDSKEGIEYLLRWAKAHKIYLSQAHVNIAKRHGVSAEGVLVTPLLSDAP